MRAATIAFGFLLVLCAVPGCGGDREQDTVPFETAIATYLADNSMGMKVSSFKALTVEGDSATATVALKTADDMVGVSVQWQFAFQRQQDAWQVTECRR